MMRRNRHLASTSLLVALGLLTALPAMADVAVTLVYETRAQGEIDPCG